LRVGSLLCVPFAFLASNARYIGFAWTLDLCGQGCHPVTAGSQRGRTSPFRPPVIRAITSNCWPAFSHPRRLATSPSTEKSTTSPNDQRSTSPGLEQRPQKARPRTTPPKSAGQVAAPRPTRVSAALPKTPSRVACTPNASFSPKRTRTLSSPFPNASTTLSNRSTSWNR
jgi:hypothetical protein